MGVGAVLLGTGVTAFGIAPLAPDAAALPVTQVFEQVSLNPLPSINLAAPTALTLYRSDTVRRDDTIQSLLRRLGVRDVIAQEQLRNHSAMATLLGGRGEKLVSVQTDENGRLLDLMARWLPDDERQFLRLHIARDGNNFTPSLSKAELTSTSQVASGVIRSSLFAAMDEANLPDSVAVQLAEMFASQIDFRRYLLLGDRFNLFY